MSDALLARLRAIYPSHDFALVPKLDLSVDDAAAPDYLVCFVHREVVIYDPLMFGFYPCDSLETYGIAQSDADAIREHNKAVGG